MHSAERIWRFPAGQYLAREFEKKLKASFFDSPPLSKSAIASREAVTT
jgi:hypothetical protein